jgi:putative transposase
MRGKKHTEEQIIVILKQTENGLKTAEVCRQHGVSEQTLVPVEGEVRRYGRQRQPQAERGSR